MSTFLSTKDAAQRLGVSARRVRALIDAERLPAIKVGHTWIINEADLACVAKRKPGWQAGVPRKTNILEVEADLNQ
jgi:excisionase family DNA binding protein